MRRATLWRALRARPCLGFHSRRSSAPGDASALDAGPSLNRGSLLQFPRYANTDLGCLFQYSRDYINIAVNLLRLTGDMVFIIGCAVTAKRSAPLESNPTASTVTYAGFSLRFVPDAE